VRPAVNVLYLPGTNCHVETMRVLGEVGADARMVFVADILAGRSRLDDADILCLPGGFSFGDHLAAGSIAGLLLQTRLRDQFAACRSRPMICICNGFQIAVRAGCFGSDVALRINANGTFVDNPIQRHYVADANETPWLAGLQGAVLDFPSAHGEGRFTYSTRDNWMAALTYSPDGNPDGSSDNIAGITSSDGLVFGLMNHPERAIDREVRCAFFANGVRAVK